MFELFKDYCKSTPVTRNRVNKKTGSNNSTIRFTTRQLSCFTQLHELFYVNKVKIVPINIEEILTPVSLAYWAMDDGSKQGKGIHLNVYAFSEEDIKRLTDTLSNKFGLKCSVHTPKNKPSPRGSHLRVCTPGARIYLKAESMIQLRTIVKHHMHPSMYYKID